ncbi:MAG: ABC transporter permease [Gemmobacter sp.]
MLWETIRLAVQAIRRNVLRSLLTVLGVVIGVASVIAMLTVGEGSSRAVAAQVSSMGSNLLIMRPGRQGFGPPGSDAPKFDLADVAAIQQLSSVAYAAPVVNSTQTVVYGNANTSTQITGTSAAYLPLGGWQVTSGRAFKDAEERGGAALCLVGTSVREELFGSVDPVGQTIRIKQLSCDVIGALGSKGASAMGSDQDDVIIMPIRTLQRRIIGNADVNSISIGLKDGISTSRGLRDIGALMRERRKIGEGADNNFNIIDMKEVASTLSGVNSVLTGMLSAVAAVSLLVGGIGIMNIMLVSVTERTREIGIRLSVGATSGQVLMQFLVEAVVLSIAGGVLGIAVGLGLAAAATSAMGIPFAPQGWVIALAFAFSAIVGVVFGFFPARRAARLDPIEALRYQ